LVLALVAWSDGAPPVPYRWVKPPPHLKATNVAPSGVRVEAAAGSVATPDGQAIVTLPAGVSGVVEIDPVDPASLGQVSGGLAPDGNAYRVAVPRLAAEGSLVLTTPYAPRALLFSGDGREWRVVSGTRIVGADGYGGGLQGPGYYLAATRPQVPVQGGGGGGSSRVLVIAAAAALGLGGLGALLWPALLRSRAGGRV
jgi:hypothetical protein